MRPASGCPVPILITCIPICLVEIYHGLFGVSIALFSRTPYNDYLQICVESCGRAVGQNGENSELRSNYTVDNEPDCLL
jgi:hypothetical protein